ncbi:MAG: hypothetical protein ACAH11_10310 [Sphingomonas sp.]
MIRLCLSAILLLTAWVAPSYAQVNNQAAADQANALPEDFRGRISYFGNHSGEVVSTLTISGGPKKDCPRPDKRCPERIGGSLEVELEFDGDIVKGTFRGTGGLRDSTLIGRRIGSQCRLYDLTDGSVWQGRCDATGFQGGVKSVPNAQVQISLNFETVGTKFRDYSEWERRRRAAWARKRHYQILRAQYEGNGSIELRFAAGVELDAFSWSLDGFRPGTMTNIRKTKPKRGAYDITGDFTLTSGAKGSVRGRVENDQIVCLEYWDIPGVCRPVSLPSPPPDPEEQPPAETSWLIPSTPHSPQVQLAMSITTNRLLR